MKPHRILALAAFASLGAFAGLYDQPYSLVEPADPSKVREEFSPAITQIDGKSTRSPRRPDPVEPGQHTVTVRFETGRVAQGPDEVSRDVQIDMKPCVRYRIAAKRVGINWEPRIYQEPIGECNKKFNKK